MSNDNQEAVVIPTKTETFKFTYNVPSTSSDNSGHKIFPINTRLFLLSHLADCFSHVFKSRYQFIIFSSATDLGYMESDTKNNFYVKILDHPRR